MVGITPIFAFLGIFLGLVSGLWWGYHQSWLMCVVAPVGGALGGGIVGALAGFIVQEVPEWTRKLSKTHPVLSGVLFWTFCVLWLAALGAFWYAGRLFIYHMRHAP